MLPDSLRKDIDNAIRASTPARIKIKDRHLYGVMLQTAARRLAPLVGRHTAVLVLKTMSGNTSRMMERLLD